MSRETKKDYIELKKHLEAYSLSEPLNNETYQKLSKEMHGDYFSLVTWLSEMHLNQESADTKQEIFNIRIEESISDIGSSFFCWIHSAYKPAKIMTRSAIENFVRGIGSRESHSFEEETNVYQLFELAKSSNIFNQNKYIRNALDSLHADYGILCADAHTSQEKNMAKISSLADFKKIDPNIAEAHKKTWTRIIKNITTILCFVFNKFLHRMHHSNKKTIISSLPKAIRPYVHDPKLVAHQP